MCSRVALSPVFSQYCTKSESNFQQKLCKTSAISCQTPSINYNHSHHKQLYKYFTWSILLYQTCQPTYKLLDAIEKLSINSYKQF